MGYAVEMMYLLGNLGRYCRIVIDLNIRDILLEWEFESQLLAWKPSYDSIELGYLENSFKHHRLINLY